MKTAALIAIVAVVVLAVGVVAWAGTRYSYGCGWYNRSPSTDVQGRYWKDSSSGQINVQESADHNSRCRHWWGSFVPWHRGRCSGRWNRCC
ncbi:MAG: hypothetical protein GWP14_07345 [Actinobacteria bacterium]|nr:hypothetical protein [Actinomycetota bacterium]